VRSEEEVAGEMIDKVQVRVPSSGVWECGSDRSECVCTFLPALTWFGLLLLSPKYFTRGYWLVGWLAGWLVGWLSSSSLLSLLSLPPLLSYPSSCCSSYKHRGCGSSHRPWVETIEPASLIHSLAL